MPRQERRKQDILDMLIVLIIGLVVAFEVIPIIPAGGYQPPRYEAFGKFAALACLSGFLYLIRCKIVAPEEIRHIDGFMGFVVFGTMFGFFVGLFGRVLIEWLLQILSQ